MVSNVANGIIHHYKLLASQYNTVTGIKGETSGKVPGILHIFRKLTCTKVCTEKATKHNINIE